MLVLRLALFISNRSLPYVFGDSNCLTDWCVDMNLDNYRRRRDFAAGVLRHLDTEEIARWEDRGVYLKKVSDYDRDLPDSLFDLPKGGKPSALPNTACSGSVDREG